jgi:hypothetical protein
MILGFMAKFPDGTPTNFKEKILAFEKFHTIRKGDRWREGMSIQMAYGVRTRKYEHLNKTIPALQTVKSTQSIEMHFNLHDESLAIYIDGFKLHPMQIKQLIKNDGLTTAQFIKHFFSKTTSFTGQLIHWTDFRYKVYVRRAIKTKGIE